MYRLLLTLSAALTLLAAVPAHAATLLWSLLLGEGSPQYDYSVDQLVVDGAGGCVVVVDRYDNNAHKNDVVLMRFDSKGSPVWSKIYPATDDIEITYIDKKVVVGSVTSPSGDKKIIVIDAAGTEATISEATTDIYNDMNGEIGAAGDKKGFFVIASDNSGSLVLRRYSYK